MGIEEDELLCGCLSEHPFPSGLWVDSRVPWALAPAGSSGSWGFFLEIERVVSGECGLGERRMGLVGFFFSWEEQKGALSFVRKAM